MKILGIDPGKRETWYACLQAGHTLARGQQVPVWDLVESAHLDLDPDRPLNERIDPTLRMLTKFLRAQKPDLVIAERYIERPGQGRGNNSETINLMLGLLYATCSQQGVSCRLVIPSAWKQWWDRTFARSWYDHWPQLNAHQADACSIGIYGYSYFTM